MSRCEDRSQEKNSLSLGIEKSPRRDLYRVAEHPVDSTRRFLEQRSARRASDSLSEGGEKGLIP